MYDGNRVVIHTHTNNSFCPAVLRDVLFFFLFINLSSTEAAAAAAAACSSSLLLSLSSAEWKMSSAFSFCLVTCLFWFVFFLSLQRLTTVDSVELLAKTEKKNNNCV